MRSPNIAARFYQSTARDFSGAIPEHVEAIARQSWGMAQRVGMQIAGLPQEEREPALAKAEISLRNTAVEMGIAGAQMDGWIDIQMRAIREGWCSRLRPVVSLKEGMREISVAPSSPRLLARHLVGWGLER
jgi:hypothetical protein